MKPFSRPSVTSARISSTSGRAISTALRPDGFVIARTPFLVGLGWSGCDYTGGNRPEASASVIMDVRAHPAPRRSELPMSTTRRGLPDDLQQSLPAAPISLSRAGVTRSAKAIRIRHDGSERLFQADVACFCDSTPPRRACTCRGFEEEVNEAIDDVVIGEALIVEALAERMRPSSWPASALRGEVTIRASYPVEKRTPVTGIPTQEMYGSSGSPRPTPAPAGGSSGSPPRG